MAYLGIDLGTGGVRCVLTDGEGAILGESAAPLKDLNVATIERGSEQDPNDWERALYVALDVLFADPTHRTVEAIAVDSTSATVLPVSEAGTPLGRAFLYNDMRAAEEAERCAEFFGGCCSPTFALPKILWMRKHLGLPDDCLYLHAADYLNVLLGGTIEVPTDFTNAMKTGVDLEREDWIEGLPPCRLPKVIAPGKRFGVLHGRLRDRWGLSGACDLVTGATDSNAAFYASGAAQPGDWSTTVGTTLAVKGLSPRRIDDPHGRVYCHKHPDGAWLPGGASNAGGEILCSRFAGRLDELEAIAAERKTTAAVVYPSVRQGERLPFASDSFRPFLAGDTSDEANLYLACLEGVACVEALVYELLEELGAPVGGTIYATGGAAESALGLQVRADLLQKVFCVPGHPNSAMGAAILAAAGSLGRPVGELSREMVTIARRVEPNPPSSYYSDRFADFRSLCQDALQ